MNKFKTYLSCLLLLSITGCTIEKEDKYSDVDSIYEDSYLVEDEMRKLEILEAIEGKEEIVGDCGEFSSRVDIYYENKDGVIKQENGVVYLPPKTIVKSYCVPKRK